MIAETVTTTAGFAALRDEWNALFAVTPEVSGFQSYAWVGACWAHPPATHQLHVGVVRARGTAVAIFPTQLSMGGRLCFIGCDVSNYSGPVFDPRDLEDSVRVWAEHLRATERVKAIDLPGLRERSPFFYLVHRRALPGWGQPVAVRTNTCSEVNLRRGWTALYERHKSKHRSTWRRKAARLASLGSLKFAETTDSVAVADAMPRMVELFAKRWDQQHIRASFASTATFQLEAAIRLAQDELVRLSTLSLDGEIIAFAYGVCGQGATSSYVLAHDDRFHGYSPGFLLLLHVLEAACERGDLLYDFSLGEARYKSLWTTGQQDVYRALWGAGRYPRATWDAARVRARSIEPLRGLKLHGWRAIVSQLGGRMDVPDAPGLSAGDTRVTFVYELAGDPDAAMSLRPCSYGEMRRLLSPRLLTLALERGFRGDDLLIVEGKAVPAGVVWRAAARRRSALVGDGLGTANDDVYYHPVPFPGGRTEDVVACVGASASGLVVTNVSLYSGSAKKLAEVAPDSGTWFLAS